MTNWKEIIFPAFEVRKRKEQKAAFITMLKEHFGDRMKVEQCGSLVKSRNIVLGNPEQAKVVYTAHYDTCAGLPFPNFITPRNLFLYLLYQLLLTVAILIPVFALSALAAWLVRLALPQHPLLQLLVAEGMLLLGMVGVLWLFMGDHPNPHTANDNTSGVITVLTLADRLGTEDGSYAFILFDNEENGLLGSGGYASAHPGVRKNTRLVNFDCVSDGGEILVLFPESELDSAYFRALHEKASSVSEKYGKNIEVCPKKGTFYPSDQANFKRGGAVCALNRSPKIGLYMDKIHTVKDTVFDENNIAALAELFTASELRGTLGD